ncbi:hypothetical protein VMCG_07457 [Cytospora schulzeri]|uniref:Uncharacterized protein n=1 Tax=Cytospora schulzeri TaxID=448051 RepID=A0A423W164_9PEZI|nr:hypothetical protein VMCG_07457 [Valsa malicola]
MAYKVGYGCKSKPVRPLALSRDTGGYRGMKSASESLSPVEKHRALNWKALGVICHVDDDIYSGSYTSSWKIYIVWDGIHFIVNLVLVMEDASCIW